MTQSIPDRSVWGTSTDDFKRHFRTYLRDLAELHRDPNRVELLQALEWCFDRWDHWRQRFFPTTDSPMLFPFFQSERGGAEFGHYSTMGSSGQPSVIHIKRSLLLGTSDTTIWKRTLPDGSIWKLVLKRDHPKRHLFIDQVVLHELVHQYLHEGAPADIRNQYEATESGRKNHKGHGALFAAECNRINQTLLPELGFEFIPIRHVKRDRGPLADRQRPSCAQFGFGEIFFVWDTGAKEPLAPEQLADNEARLQQALAYFDGAVAVVIEAAKIDTDFPAPFSIDCADTCHQALTAHDQEHETDLVASFHLAVLKQMQAAGTLDQMLAAVGHSAAPVNIPPAAGQNGNGHRTVAIPESGPTVPASGDNTDQPVATTRGAFDATYPLSDPVDSLRRLDADIKAAGNARKLCAQFDLKDGSSASRLQKKLRAAIEALVAGVA